MTSGRLRFRRGRAVVLAVAVCAAVSSVGSPNAAAAPGEATKLYLNLGRAANFGQAVAVSGTTALIGAPKDDTTANKAGSAAIMVRSGNEWSEQARLIASPSRTGDQFGYSVAVDADTALVGAPYDNGNGGLPDAGSAYVFVRSGTTWTQQAKLTPSEPISQGGFGWSVALQGDVAVIGAPRSGEESTGLAYVFSRSETTWSERAILVAADAQPLDYFGLAVAIDQGSVVVGAIEHDTSGGEDAGAAYVFVPSGTTWVQQAELTAADGSGGDWFGTAVDISGGTILVGAEFDDVRGRTLAGSAYVFSRAGIAWTEQAKLVASDAHANDRLGIAVTLQGDTAVVGAYSYQVGRFGAAGAAYVFTRDGTAWTERERLIAMDKPGNVHYGSALALDGSTLLAGAPSDHSGTVYAYWR